MPLTYLILALLGFILPYSQLIPFFVNNGLDIPLFWSQLLINHISRGFAADLFVSSVVFWLYVFKEGVRLQMKYLWVYVLLNLIVGLSFALPLFIWMRSRNISVVQDLGK